MLLNELLSSTKNPYGRMMELFSSGLSIINGKAKELDTLYQIRQFYTVPAFSGSLKHKLNSEINANDYPMIYKRIYNVFAEELIKISDMDKEVARKGAKEALDIFQEVNTWQDKRNLKIYDIYVSRCEEYIKTPPIDFNGVFIHTTKGWLAVSFKITDLLLD